MCPRVENKDIKLIKQVHPREAEVSLWRASLLSLDIRVESFNSRCEDTGHVMGLLNSTTLPTRLTNDNA